ncbi:hypothetical protein OIB37_31455 [Streptomyces sp. NBC_00820]|uniref:hypothetical protein n=1 Tax=Streptomyces sp. NBC_00820 TaxID=2975842 RepID=UPI002ED2D8BB|nr:hypothetical protein OIB37_31455 [Streptomyces sp. NBC_00820]
MNRPPRTARVLASALATGALLVTAACAGDDESTRATPAVERPAAASSPSPSPSLTKDGAKAALITEADIEDAWTQVDDAASWRDKLLTGKVDVAAFLTGKADAADCQKLLDSVYDETVLGRPSGASALTGFTEGDSRLLYQVGEYGEKALDKSLDWVENATAKCDRFTVDGADGEQRTVDVVSMSLPKAGDARQGLTMTVQGNAGGEPVTLALDMAVVRVGGSGITVTNGGPSEVDHDSTKTAVQQGAKRLKDVLAGKTPPADPGMFD